MHGENSKTFFIEKVIGECGGEAAAPLRLLDLGCGTAAYIPYLLKKFEHLEYVGLEPYGPTFKKAKENVGDHPRARLFNQLGYTDMEGVEKGSFDVVMSMSALEHIKQLDRFIALSAA